ncbi:ABC transporter permease [Solibacillus merdavium]|uniref:Transport permease protein n=1 Tax=Solibacillus merdavium TaxID=2762218 RepID=A0ABR8XKL1_9BACL|nr:ABC transporter permease [Solibacillus merdavium]MBD8032481.1 ABC transporter permease [Solibacillus merdavium]
MRSYIFAGRVTKEVLRDPISLFFGIVFPIILLLLLNTINRNVPKNLFSIDVLTPGIAVFSLSFIALFAAQTLSKDRTSAYLARLLTTPMTATDFILGYSIPLAAIAFIQSIICFITAYFMGFTITLHILLALICLLFASFIFIGIGLICGILLSEKAAVGLCGALLTNLTALLSGAWFDLSLIGGTFEKIAYILPFVHIVDLVRALLANDYSATLPHLYIVIVYTVIIYGLAIFFFRRQTIED